MNYVPGKRKFGWMSVGAIVLFAILFLPMGASIAEPVTESLVLDDSTETADEVATDKPSGSRQISYPQIVRSVPEFGAKWGVPLQSVRYEFTTGPQLHTWTDATGNFTVDAEFLDLLEGKVRLKRADGRTVTLALEQLSAADQEFAKTAAGGVPTTVTAGQPIGKLQELKNDDGKPTGKKSFPRGIASAFKVTKDGYSLSSVRIHGGRYGHPRPPQEDFHVSLCDKEFNLIADFPFPYSKFKRGEPGWVSLRVKPTEVPREFIICLNFKPERTKGVYVSHDAEGRSLVGLPGKPAGAFTGGDWMIRPLVVPPDSVLKR